MGNTENPSTNRSLPNLGSVSVDFSQISSGIVVVLVSGVPFVTLNLHWVLGSLSKTSKRKLAAWLTAKSSEASHNWPLGHREASSSSGIAAPVTPTGGDSTGAQPTAGTLESTPSTKPTNAMALNNLAQKLCRVLRMESLEVLSGSILDTLRQLLKNGDLVFAIRNSLLGKDPSDKYTIIPFSKLVELAKENLKLKRSQKGNTGEKRKEKKSRPGAPTVVPR